MQLISGNRIAGLIASLLIVALLCGPGVQVSAAVQKEDTEEEEKAAEESETSEAQYPKRMTAHEGWEWFLYIPGYIVFLPIKLVFVGIGETAGYVH